MCFKAAGQQGLISTEERKEKHPCINSDEEEDAGWAISFMF